MPWQRLIRFEDTEGRTHFGEPVIDGDAIVDIDEVLQSPALRAEVYVGTSIFSLNKGIKIVGVKKILPLLSAADIPIIKCIGLNYMKHIQEGGRKPPPYPSVFIKPKASVAGYHEDIAIPELAQETLDYEGELSIVIGKTGKDIAKEEALDYVAGFVASNDGSCRKWQRDPAFAGVVPQWCFSKGFDKFAPLGPMLVSPRVVGNAGNLQLRTLVNGEVRQDTNTNDLLFNVETIISFVSQGTTLEAGTVIMTGTPSGVAMGMRDPLWLKNGDLVEVKIESLGSVKNRMVFA
ncbi:uncharacterized protein Z520_11275 [Fonsecaea multimorphosa CBS 102226]|uniref:Fumarylacetoacetase-like C-terminal domain-containing protein n=1 Tax=Fonsecaea multimorphosa CBS 102226 TaxID=1442371 RepID=A0A0D2JIL2_9EURO|nr:uncharacterized protein Z520_11275 [Fonsecaea multimorphosa CBS 102226]KIX93002.1 hypothetical protein Z520_11275 [Fonsecaea multimorphosa CBS 102226]OAL18250.1 hypothetical protein AYO22_10828 [Fonsecaea multimorphosa]